MLSAFYGAFSGVCFTLLGLWWGVVQFRQNKDNWLADPVRKRVAYDVMLHFLLPGTMAMIALISSDNPLFWRIGFFVAAIAGAVEMITLLGRTIPATGGRAIAFISTVLYSAIALIALLSFLPIFGLINVPAIEIEAVLAGTMVIVGINFAWLVFTEPL
jgi:hypothetical protein